MIKNLLITYLFLITNVFAGLPPTTVKGQAETVKTTTFNVEVPYSQATTTAAGTRLLEVGNNNILANGSFEHSTYDTGWTCSLGTKTKETTTVFKGKNSMKIVSAGAGTRCYIYSTTDAAKLKGQQGHATVRVNSTDSVLQVCALAGGTTSAFDTNCVTVPVTTTETPWKTIVIPTIMDGTGNGVVIKSAETLTKSVFVDEVEYKHGLPVQAVNGARLVGTVTITGCASAWSTTSTSYAEFATQTGCTYTVSGQAIAPATNIPAIRFPTLQAGDYRLEYEGAIYEAASGTDQFLQFWDGSNTARESSHLFGSSTGFIVPGISQSISYATTQSNVTLSIRGKVTAGGNVQVYGTTASPGVIKVWYFPPASTIYTSDNYKTVSSDSLPFAFKATAIVDSDPVGTFNTYTYAINTSTATISASAPTQTVADMNANGFRIFARPYNAASTSAQPARVDIKIGKGLTQREIQAYAGTAKTVPVSHDHWTYSSTVELGAPVLYNEVTGVLSIESAVAYSSSVTSRFIGFDVTGAGKTDAYFVFKAQKNDTINGSFEKIEKCATANECNDTFSAGINSSGTVYTQNTPWIETASWSPTGQLNVTFKSGIFTVTPMCWAIPSITGQRMTINTNSSSSVSFLNRSNDGTGNVNTDANVFCQKQGVDYFPKTAKVASSIGVPTVPGITTQAIDTFSVSYGTTNATTACSASPCSYLDQIGNAVTSVTRSGTGSYSINTTKTYTKLKCNINSSSPSGTGVSSGVRCENCSSIPFYTTNVNVAGVPFFDTYGTLLCQGSY